MKKAAKLIALLAIVTPAIAGNFQIGYSHVSYPESNKVLVGKLKPEIEEIKLDEIQLVEFDISRLPMIISGVGKERTNLHLCIYMSSPNPPKINIAEKNITLVELLDKICEQIGYSSWIQDETIYILPDEFLESLKPY